MQNSEKCDTELIREGKITGIKLIYHSSHWTLIDSNWLEVDRTEFAQT